MDKIKLTKQEFDELYEIIKGDTPQPDLDKLIADKPETVLTEEEEIIDDKLMEEYT